MKILIPSTLRCLINWEVKIHGSVGDKRFFLNLIKGGVKINKGGGGEGRWNFKKPVNIGNEWKKRRKCLILMLDLKVTKQTRSEASKNKVIIKGVSNISVN